MSRDRSQKCQPALASCSPWTAFTNDIDDAPLILLQPTRVSITSSTGVLIKNSLPVRTSRKSLLKGGSLSLSTMNWISAMVGMAVRSTATDLGSNPKGGPYRRPLDLSWPDCPPSPHYCLLFPRSFSFRLPHRKARSLGGGTGSGTVSTFFYRYSPSKYRNLRPNFTANTEFASSKALSIRLQT